MDPAVVFDSQPMTLVEQIRPANHSAPPVANGNLRLGTRKSTRAQQHPQPRLHRRLRGRLNKLNHTPEVGDARSPGLGSCPGPQLSQAHPPIMQSGVGDDDRLGQAQPAAQVGNRPHDRCGGHPAHANAIVFVQGTSAYLDAGTPGDPSSLRNRRFDRVARYYVDSVQPCCRETRKGGTGRQPAQCGGQSLHRALGEPHPYVGCGTQSLPAAAGKMPPAEPSPPRLVDSERTTRQLSGDQWPATHRERGSDTSTANGNCGC